MRTSRIFLPGNESRTRTQAIRVPEDEIEQADQQARDDGNLQRRPGVRSGDRPQNSCQPPFVAGVDQRGEWDQHHEAQVERRDPAAEIQPVRQAARVTVVALWHGGPLGASASAAVIDSKLSDGRGEYRSRSRRRVRGPAGAACRGFGHQADTRLLVVETPLLCSILVTMPLVASKNVLVTSVHPPRSLMVNRPGGVENVTLLLVTPETTGR